MKQRNLASLLLAGAMTAALLTGPAQAAESPSPQEIAATRLQAEGLMNGDEHGDLHLDKGLTRAELACLISPIVLNPEHVAWERDYYFDMFAGVGGFRAGLTRVGGFQCVGHCEIDKYAEASYRAIHDIREEERYYPDARAIDPDDLPQFDLLCRGFPCQAFSNAGRRKGFADARGTLFFEIARLAEAKRPRYLLLENVPYVLKCIRHVMSCKQL